MNLLDFEGWTILNIIWAETGADREYDFDIERELEKEYEKYLENQNIK